MNGNGMNAQAAGPNLQYVSPGEARRLLTANIMAKISQDRAGANAMISGLRNQASLNILQAIQNQVDILMLQALDQCESVGSVAAVLESLLSQKELTKLLLGLALSVGPATGEVAATEGIHDFPQPQAPEAPTEEPEPVA